MNCYFTQQCPYRLTKCSNHCNLMLEFNYLMDNSNIPDGFKSIGQKIYPEEIDLEAFSTLNEIKLDIEHFVEDGRFLYLWSSHTGNYKTTWAMKLLKTYLAMVALGNNFRDRAWVEYVPSFLLASKNFDDKEERIQHIERATYSDLVILDDVGAVQNSSYDITILSSVIDYRYSHKLSTIFTSNLSVTALNNSVGARITDRMASDIVIEFCGGSRRISTNKYVRGDAH